MALIHVNFFSETLRMCVVMDAIIPQIVKTPTQVGGVAKSKPPYKTLYLLHGASEDHSIWQRYTSIERYAYELGLAVIMPTTHMGWYTDMHQGLKWWTFISRELPEICRQFFPLSDSREDTFAAGLSMGGYGAAKLGLGMGETFSHVAPLSGALDVAALTADPSYGLGPVFGPAEHISGGENDLFALAEKRKYTGNMPRVYQWCGTEDFLYEHNTRFRDHLLKLGYDLTYEEGSGDHQWKYWDDVIKRVLDWLPLR